MNTGFTPQDIDSPMILLGCVGAPWGVKGHNRIQSYTSPVGNIFEYATWYIHSDEPDGFKPIKITDTNNHPSQLVARLEGCQDREGAQALVHTKIYVKRDELAPCEDGEYYWCDLVGLEVQDTEGVLLGHIEGLYETGAHDNMVVKHLDKQIDIPFVVGEFVLKVDLAAKLVVVDWDLR